MSTRVMQVPLKIWRTCKILSPTLQVPNRFKDGKRPNRSTVNNLSAGVNSALLHVFDSNTHKYFLVDTGSELSILPPDLAKATRPTNQPLIAANGSPHQIIWHPPNPTSTGATEVFMALYCRRSHSTHNRRRFPPVAQPAGRPRQ